MEDSIYTIKNLCDELNEPRQKVRRRLEKLEIKAINEDTRAYKNDPLKYDHQSFLKLAEEFDVQIRDKEFMSSVQHRTTERTTNEQHRTTERTTNEQHRTTEETSKDKLIKVLENQLEEANKSRANLEKLLDQQQQLTLISNKKLEALRLEFENPEVNQEKEVEDKNPQQKKKRKWYDVFKKNK